MQNIKFYMSKAKIFLLSVVTGLSVAMASCDVFDVEPLDSVPDTQIWNDEGLATLYLNNLYYQVMPTFGGTTNSSLSDETYGSTTFMYGRATNESVGDFSSATYQTIRKINILLENIETGSISKTAAKKIKGQAMFLRAWIYWKLVNLYGGVPMIMETGKLVENGDISPNVYVTRNKTSECIKLISNDLDSAFAYLPAKWDDDNYGRITRGAAIAFKGRVLLFYASPQFNPNNLVDRWQLAYDVNKQAIDTLTKDGYGLHTSFEELFTNCKEKTKEAIMVRVYDNTIASSTVAVTHAYDNSVRPAYLARSGGGTANNATWNLVQAFPIAADGYPVAKAKNTTSTNKYYQNSFWINRDARLKFSIAYNGAAWPLNGNASYKLWTYYHTKNVNGVISMVSTESTPTVSGFYCRKYVNPNISSTVTNEVGTDWMEIRYAEVLLNYAECANELGGKYSEVYNALNQIRNGRTDVKVGMGYIVDNQNDQSVLREIIMTERECELAFENKRYWDLRRRNMFAQDLGPNIKKLNGSTRNAWRIYLNETALITPSYMESVRNTDVNSALPSSYLTWFKDGFAESLDTETAINFPQPDYNFFAIPQTNIDKNPLLEQNPAWGGNFNPYE